MVNSNKTYLVDLSHLLIETFGIELVLVYY